MKIIELETPTFLPKTCKAYAFGECYIMVDQEPGHGWHMSISHQERYPTWDEIREARYQFCPDDITMAMLLPPKSEYVNVHNNCFHLYESDTKTS